MSSEEFERRINNKLETIIETQANLQEAVSGLIQVARMHDEQIGRNTERTERIERQIEKNSEQIAALDEQRKEQQERINALCSPRFIKRTQRHKLGAYS